MERDFVYDIRARPFGGDLVLTQNEKDALRRTEQLRRGNQLLAVLADHLAPREVAKEPR